VLEPISPFVARAPSSGTSRTDHQIDTSFEKKVGNHRLENARARSLHERVIARGARIIARGAPASPDASGMRRSARLRSASSSSVRGRAECGSAPASACVVELSARPSGMRLSARLRSASSSSGARPSDAAPATRELRRGSRAARVGSRRSTRAACISPPNADASDERGRYARMRFAPRSSAATIARREIRSSAR